MENEKQKKVEEIMRLISEYQNLYYPFDYTDEEFTELWERDFDDLMNNRNIKGMIQSLKQECMTDLAEDDFYGAQMVLTIIEKIFEMAIKEWGIIL